MAKGKDLHPAYDKQVRPAAAGTKPKKGTAKGKSTGKSKARGPSRDAGLVAAQAVKRVTAKKKQRGKDVVENVIVEAPEVVEGAEFAPAIRNMLSSLEDEIGAFLIAKALAGEAIPDSVKTSFGTLRLVVRTDEEDNDYVDVLLPILTFDPQKF